MNTRIQAPLRRRAGFTLLETMLAAAIGALVVFACLGMFFLMSRTDRALDARATEQADLERLRWVMEKTFSTLLMSDESRTVKTGDVAVAVADQLGAGIDALKGDGAKDGAVARQTALAGLDVFANDKTKGGGGSKGGAGTGGKGGAADPGASDKDATGKTSNQRTDVPPRLWLTLGDPVAGMMSHHPAPKEPMQEVGPPQRLEVVLFQSPVPTDAVDPVERALNSTRTHRQSKQGAWGAKANSDKAAADAAAGGTGGSAAGDQLANDDAMSMPARAVRGAFEVRPQPPKGARVAGGQVTQVANAEPTGLWEVWWVPLPRVSSDGNVEVYSTEATDPSMPADVLPQPYLIASNLRYIKWTAFHERERQNELLSVWSGDLPAYVEVEAETAAGLAVNWMFEIDWAVGPEVPHLAQSPSDKANANPDAKGAADATGGGSKAPSGDSFGAFKGAK